MIRESNGVWTCTSCLCYSTSRESLSHSHACDYGVEDSWDDLTPKFYERVIVTSFGDMPEPLPVPKCSHCNQPLGGTEEYAEVLKQIIRSDAMADFWRQRASSLLTEIERLDAVIKELRKR